MRFLLVLAFASVAFAGTVLPHTGLRPMSQKIDEYVADLVENDGEIEIVVDNEDGTMGGKLRRERWIFFFCIFLLFFLSCGEF